MISKVGSTELKSAIIPGLGAILLLILVAAALLPTLDSVVYSSQGSDEAFYRHYAATIQAEGLGAFPGLSQAYLANESQWLYPSPIRVGFIAVAAAWMSLWGATFSSLSLLSVASHLALVAVCVLGLFRCLGAWRALLVAALVGFSPLLLGLGRRALQDSFVTLAGAVCLVLFLHCCERRHPGWKVAFCLCFAFAILAKETALLLAPPLALFAWYRAREMEAPRQLWWNLVALGGAPLLAMAAWVPAAGGIQPLVDIIRITVASPSTNPYAIQFGSGPWFRYLLDFLLLSPWVVLLAVAFAGKSMSEWVQGRESRPLPLYCLLVTVLLVAEYSMFTKNVRYLALLELPLCIMAVLMICALLERLRWPRASAGLAVALISLGGYLQFSRIFLEWGVYDTVTQNLLRALSIVP